MNRLVIALVALVSLVAVGLAVVIGGRQSVSVSEPASLSENMAPRTSTAEKMRTVENPANTAGAASTTTGPQSSGWDIVDVETLSSEELPEKLREELPAVLLAVNRERLMSARPGEKVMLPVASKQTQVMQVDRIKEHTEHDVRTIKGHVIKRGVRFPAVITLGQSSTLATIASGLGVFEVRGTRESAWLYDQNDLSPATFSGPDYVVPTQELPEGVK